jgi:hypothetical protein
MKFGRVANVHLNAVSNTFQMSLFTEILRFSIYKSMLLKDGVFTNTSGLNFFIIYLLSLSGRVLVYMFLSL